MRIDDAKNASQELINYLTRDIWYFTGRTNKKKSAFYSKLEFRFSLRLVGILWVAFFPFTFFLHVFI